VRGREVALKEIALPPNVPDREVSARIARARVGRAAATRTGRRAVQASPAPLALARAAVRGWWARRSFWEYL
jgi:hypothetical protein